MRGHHEQDAALKAFIGARTQDLHHDAFQLTARQDAAEQLVVAVLTDLRRQGIDLSRAGATAHLRMVQLAAKSDTPTEVPGNAHLPERFRPLTRLSPRQRAVLLLQAVAGYDDRAVSRALQLSSRATTELLRSIPYGTLPNQTNELRSLLEDFGDLATSPSATTTIQDVFSAPGAPRRPWWTYAAAFLVIALTATCVVVTQGWHKDWLTTPDGLNHAHGTHFPAYSRGYQLVDIREMAPGIAQDVTTGAAGAVALPCGVVDPTVRLSVQSAASEGDEGDSCPRSATRARLTLVKGRASAMVLGGKGHEEPIAVYRKIPLSEYPVATNNFEVQHDLTLGAARKAAAGGRTPADATKRPVLTLRGTAVHHNGTFTGTLRLPPGGGELDSPQAHTVGLLSPTTSGRYRVDVDHGPAVTSCGEPQPPTYEYYRGCLLLDHHVPQLEYLQDVSTDFDTVQVQVIVKGARGPWTLQIAADTYDSFDTGTGSTD